VFIRDSQCWHIADSHRRWKLAYSWWAVSNANLSSSPRKSVSFAFDLTTVSPRAHLSSSYTVVVSARAVRRQSLSKDHILSPGIILSRFSSSTAFGGLLSTVRDGDRSQTIRKICLRAFTVNVNRPLVLYRRWYNDYVK